MRLEASILIYPAEPPLLLLTVVLLSVVIYDQSPNSGQRQFWDNQKRMPKAQPLTGSHSDVSLWAMKHMFFTKKLRTGRTETSNDPRQGAGSTTRACAICN